MSEIDEELEGGVGETDGGCKFSLAGKGEGDGGRDQGGEDAPRYGFGQASP